MNTPIATPEASNASLSSSLRTRCVSSLTKCFLFRLPISMTVLNVTGLSALVYLVVWHGVSATDVCVFIAMYVLGMLGLEVGMHRHFSHAAFAASPGLRITLGILGSMGGQGSALLWAINHRKHHRFADRESDPHSPASRGSGFGAALRGWWHGHFAWHFRETSSIDRRELLRYGRDLITDRKLMAVDRHFWTWVALGMLLPATAGLLVTGTLDGTVTAFLWGGPIRIFVVDNVVWASTRSHIHEVTAHSRPEIEVPTSSGWYPSPSVLAGTTTITHSPARPARR